MTFRISVIIPRVTPTDNAGRCVIRNEWWIAGGRTALRRVHSPLVLPGNVIRADYSNLICCNVQWMDFVFVDNIIL